MATDNIVPMLLGGAAAIVALFVLIAYMMAAEGEFLDTYFGKAVFLMSWVSFIPAYFIYSLKPAFVRDLGGDPDLSLFYAIGVVAIAGAIGAVLDFFDWLGGN
jgi:hypothetical protein